jgi:ATP-dependent Lhr-like helicase
MNPRRQAGRQHALERSESGSRRRATLFDRRARRVSSTALTAVPRAIAPEAAGRWSLVSQLVYGQPSQTEQLTARTSQLLERYGVLTREAVQAEGISGGFSTVYGVLKALEEAGRVRRGYFVSGLGATQFALPGALDRLRALREPSDRIESILISATDPANPYGAALPWPERADGRRPMRQAGAVVILVDGCLAGWIGRGERHLLTFADSVGERDPDEVRYEIARVLAEEVTSFKRRAVFVTEVDGEPARETPMAAALLEANFIHTAHGFLKRL